MNDLLYTSWNTNQLYDLLTTSSYSYTTSAWANTANTNSYYYDFNSTPTLKEILQEGTSYHLEYCFIKKLHNFGEEKDKIVILVNKVEKDTITYVRLDFGISYKNGIVKMEHTVSRKWFTDYIGDFTISCNRYIYDAENCYPSFYVIGGDFVLQAMNKFFGKDMRHKLKTYNCEFKNKSLIYVVYNDTVHTIDNTLENRAIVTKNFHHLIFKISPYFKNYEKGGNAWLAHYIYPKLKITSDWQYIERYCKHYSRVHDKLINIEEILIYSLEKSNPLSCFSGNKFSCTRFKDFLNTLEHILCLPKNTFNKSIAEQLSQSFNDIPYDIKII